MEPLEVKLSVVERAAARLDLKTLLPRNLPPPAPARIRPVPAIDLPASDTFAKTRTRSRSTQRDGAGKPIPLDPDRLWKLGLIDWSAGRSTAAEELRIIKRQLLQRELTQADDQKTRRNLVMITSATRGEGKTFLALNLALSFAREPDREVLLIDACDNDNSLRSLVSTPPKFGWRDLVTDLDLDVYDAVTATDIPGLSLMFPGQQRQQEAELLGSGPMQQLLGELTDNHPNRMVLIDAPACMESSDPVALSRVVGQVILVVEANSTQQPIVENALRQLRPCRNVCLTLNKTAA